MLIPAFASDEALRALVASSVAGQLIARVVPSHSQAALDGVVNTLIALRSLLQQCGDLIGSIDVNPLLVTDKGCIAVDALIVRR